MLFSLSGKPGAEGVLLGLPLFFVEGIGEKERRGRIYPLVVFTVHSVSVHCDVMDD